MSEPSIIPNVLPRIIVVGAGFGGLAAARQLADVDAEVLIVDRQNHHLFQPLLYQVATAQLSPGDIAEPIRSVFAKQPNATVVLGAVVDVDPDAKTVTIDNGMRHDVLTYDHLVIASGATHAYFGNDQWAQFAPGLKTVHDATSIRHRILTALEKAEMAATPEDREKFLTFVVVGGGPTGVEMAGAMAELARSAMARDFRRIGPDQARILLIEAGPRLLPPFPEELSKATKDALERMGVEVLLGAPVSDCNSEGVVVGDRQIRAEVAIWAAGVQASALTRQLGAEVDKAGRVKVQSDFSVPGHEDIHVIGDAAAVVDSDGRKVPGVAPAAKQAGEYVGKLIRARMKNESLPPPFRYKDYGNLATIGRRAAVADFGKVRLKGALAWWLWGFAHIFFLIGFRNRISVMINWAWWYVTRRRGVRIITRIMVPRADAEQEPGRPDEAAAPARPGATGR